MSAQRSFWSAAVLALALAAVCGCQQPSPAGGNAAIGPDPVFIGAKADLPAAAAAATIKAAFPNAIVCATVANKDLGFPVYVVQLAGDKNASTAEVTPDGTLVWSHLNLTQADLPAPVAKAAAADGYAFASAEKITTTADCKFNGPKFAKLATPTTAYQVTLVVKPTAIINLGSHDPRKSVITVAPDGTILNPLTPLVRASAVVPAGKFVLRVNCGSNTAYTDNSGVTWTPDQKYAEGKTTWGFIGQFDLAAQRTGLHVLGTDAPGVYDCERYKMGAYRFNLPNGKYTVRIHNNESWEGAKKVGERVWGVKINGKTVIDRIDLANDPGFLKPVVHEVKDIEVTDGKLVVEPYAVRTDNDQHPFVDAYEIIAQ